MSAQRAFTACRDRLSRSPPLAASVTIITIVASVVGAVVGAGVIVRPDEVVLAVRLHAGAAGAVIAIGNGFSCIFQPEQPEGILARTFAPNKRDLRFDTDLSYDV